MWRVTVTVSTLIGWTRAVSRSPGALAIVWQLEFVSIQPLSRKSRVPEREEAGQGLRVTWACCRGRETERPCEKERLFVQQTVQTEWNNSLDHCLLSDVSEASEVIVIYKRTHSAPFYKFVFHLQCDSRFQQKQSYYYFLNLVSTFFLTLI